MNHEPTGRPALQRDLGEQPLSTRMAERELKPRDLVAASEDQLTHKAVSRAMKGRRLTPNTMAKIVRAWNRATGGTDVASDLFSYRA